MMNALQVVVVKLINRKKVFVIALQLAIKNLNHSAEKIKILIKNV